MKRRTFAVRRLILSGALVTAAALLAGCGGGAASPGTVAQAAGATSCDNSGFFVESKLTNEKDVIYDCRFADALPKCVTYSGNIARDATTEVSYLFAGSLNGGKPKCLAEWKAAKAQRAQTAYNAALARDRETRWHRGYTAYWKGVGAYQLPNVYFKFLPPSSYSCSAYISSCWKLEIVTRNGCPAALSIELREYDSGNTQVGTGYGNGGSLGPHTPSIVEVDSLDSSARTASVGSITCF